ncbi:MAG: CHASE2 domain-containing protein [Microscillaceae bacterium]|jgi:CHASE2 domain-containing sensor protein|nr:CHASE2 domain-containing protein [Microscillaceae bacterium]
MLKRFLRGAGNGVVLTILTFALLLGVTSIPLNFEFLNPIQNMFKDFDSTDIVFSRIRKTPIADERIVLVNIGNLGRSEVAQIVSTLNKFEPKIIGIDALFRKPRDPAEDSTFAQALSEVKNLVMVSELKNSSFNEKKSRYDTLNLSYEMFVQHAYTGYANLTTEGSGNQQEFNTSRSFMPKVKVRDNQGKERNEYAFGVKIAELYNPQKVKKFLARNQITEFINFRGNVIPTGPNNETVFSVINYDQILVDEPEIEKDYLKGKIVLLGFMGEKNYIEKSYVDKFYTPLNENYVGKSTLDMFGVVVHANIISMILNEDYIDELNPYLEILLDVIVCLFCASLFSYFFRHIGFWFDSVTLIAQFVFLILLFGLNVYAFLLYNLKININTALLCVVFSGLIVEMYHGLINKLFEYFTRKKDIKLTTVKNESK